MKRAIVAAGLLTMLGSPIQAQSTYSQRVVPCDTTVAQHAPLALRDEASRKGAAVENPILITLENGFRAVQFSVRHTLRSEYQPDILKVRYTVRWTDLCGRQLKPGSDIVNGFTLDPHSQKFVQSTAPHRDGAHASLHVYIVN